LCFGLGGGGHPVKVIDPDAEGGDQFSNERLHLGFGFGREVFSGVDFPDFIAEDAVDEGDAALVARALLGDARKSLAEEVEAFVGERLGKNGRVLLEGVVGEIVFPGIERSGCDDGRFSGDRSGLPDVEAALAAEARGFEIGGPIEARSFGSEVGWRPAIVCLMDVFVLCQGLVLLGNRGF
jgi:hypothetical protein